MSKQKVEIGTSYRPPELDQDHSQDIERLKSLSEVEMPGQLGLASGLLFIESLEASNHPEVSNLAISQRRSLTYENSFRRIINNMPDIGQWAEGLSDKIEQWQKIGGQKSYDELRQMHGPEIWEVANNLWSYSAQDNKAWTPKKELLSDPDMLTLITVACANEPIPAQEALSWSSLEIKERLEKRAKIEMRAILEHQVYGRLFSPEQLANERKRENSRHYKPLSATRGYQSENQAVWYKQSARDILYSTKKILRKERRIISKSRKKTMDQMSLWGEHLESLHNKNPAQASRFEELSQAYQAGWGRIDETPINEVAKKLLDDTASWRREAALKDPALFSHATEQMRRNFSRQNVWNPVNIVLFRRFLMDYQANLAYEVALKHRGYRDYLGAGSYVEHSRTEWNEFTDESKIRNPEGYHEKYLHDLSNFGGRS